jgi:hypothetical protein
MVYVERYKITSHAVRNLLTLTQNNRKAKQELPQQEIKRLTVINVRDKKI